MVTTARFFAPEIEVLAFPAWDCLPYDRLSPTAGVSAQRMATLTRLAMRKPGDAPVLVVAAAGLGTLNHSELTVRVLGASGLSCAGLVIGSWPAEPDLAQRCNLTDLPRVWLVLSLIGLVVLYPLLWRWRR